MRSQSRLRQTLGSACTALAILTVGVIAGCEENTFEDAGEEIDEGLEEIEDEFDDATDG